MLGRELVYVPPVRLVKVIKGVHRTALRPSHAIMTARNAAIPLTNRGMGTPFSAISHAKNTRTSCKRAMIAKMTAARRE